MWNAVSCSSSEPHGMFIIHLGTICLHFWYKSEIKRMIAFSSLSCSDIWGNFSEKDSVKGQDSEKGESRSKTDEADKA